MATKDVDDDVIIVTTKVRMTISVKDVIFLAESGIRDMDEEIVELDQTTTTAVQ